MMRATTTASLLAVLALAGCTAPLGDDTYELTAVGFEHEGTTATFGLDVEGRRSTTSDHIGGHYWLGEVDDPTAAFADRAGDCAHVPGGGEVPGTFEVTCDLKHFGELAVHGHLRITEEDETFNYWTPAQTVTVTPDDDTFTLTVEDLESVEGGVSFTLNVTGSLQGFSDHIGGHVWADSTDAPTVPGSDGGCSHVPGGGTVPGTFEVTCTFDGEAPWHYRGHLRVTVGDEQWNYWTTEQTFEG